MATSLCRFDRLVSAYRTRYGPEGDALALAVGLLIGLVGVVPTFTLAVGYFDVPIPLPSLVATAGVLATYTCVVFVSRRVRVGTLVALVVLGTFSANVPLSNTEYPGALGANVWLFELPLIAGLTLAVYDGWHRDLVATVRRNRADLPLSHVLFGAFVVWTVFAGLFGAGPSLAAGLFFALHMLTALGVFVLVAGAVARGWLQFRTVLSLLVVAAIAHMAFAVAQLVHGRNFGFSYVGEVAGNAPLVEILGTTLRAGPYVSGLTGNSSPFTALMLLATPVLALYATRGASTRWARIASGVFAVGSLVLVRITLKDAARGAAFIVIVGVVIAAVSMTVSARRGRDDRSSGWRARVRGSRRAIVSAFGTVALGLAALVIQVRILTGPGAPDSSSSGSSASADGSSSAGSSSNAGSASSSGGAGGAGDAGGSAASADVSAKTASDAAATGSSEVFGFNLASAGFRETQYFAALDAGLTHPLFGLGGANFAYVVERYGMESATEPGIEIGNAVHNAYLSVLSGTGVPGFLLFCGLLLSILWTAVTLVRDSREERWLACAALIGVVGYGALMFWNVMLVTIVGTIAFFAFAGAIVGTESKRAGAQSHSHTSTHAVGEQRS